jgi:PleD family two-component response regulator
MSRTVQDSDSHVRPPIVVVGVEQEWAARSLESILGPKGFAAVRAYSGAQALDLAEVASPDVVLLDSRLPDMDGIDVCRALRDEHRVGPHVPVVITTSGSTPREFMRAAYEAGAWSVWEQPIDGELLIMRLQTWVAAKRVVDEAERVSLVDTESGLYTHRGLKRRAAELMADAARHKTPISCIAITPVVSRSSSSAEPLDDALTPAQVSHEIAQLMASVSRGSDVVGRISPSEFAILAPMTERDGAIELIERLRDRTAKLSVRTAIGAVRVSLRAGVATANVSPMDQRDGSGLLIKASTALRYANASRTSDVQIFEAVPATFV